MNHAWINEEVAVKTFSFCPSLKVTNLWSQHLSSACLNLDGDSAQMPKGLGRERRNERMVRGRMAGVQRRECTSCLQIIVDDVSRVRIGPRGIGAHIQ